MKHKIILWNPMKYFVFLLTPLLCFQFSCESKSPHSTQTTSSKNITPPIAPKKGEDEKKVEAEKKKEKVVKEFSKLREVNFDKNALPKEAQYKGKIISGISWEDKKGLNNLVFSKTQHKDDTSIYINHFLVGKDGFKHVRELKEYMFCSQSYHDIDLRESVLALTDLDDDKIGEATFAYSTHCDDGLAAPFKLFLLEEGKKYKLSGRLRIEKGKRFLNQKAAESSTKFIPNDLVKSNEVFRNHLEKIWKSSQIEMKDAKNFGHSATLVGDILTIDGKIVPLPAEFLKNNLCLGAQLDFSFQDLDQKEKKSVLYISAHKCESLEDPPNAHLFYFVDETGIPHSYFVLSEPVNLRFPGQGKIEYTEDSWAACKRAGVLDNKDFGKVDGKFKIKFHDRILRYNKEKKQLVETETRETKTEFDCDHLSACPYVYILTKGNTVYVGEILRNVRGEKSYTLQSLELPKTQSETIEIRLQEEKKEVTYLDEIFITIGGRKVYPNSCKGFSPPNYCGADRRYEIMEQGDHISLKFKGQNKAAKLWARGYYIPQ